MIPKIVHYCWFGGKPLSEDTQKYIATWKAFMPGWEIMEWNEDNSHLDEAPLYVQEAYKCKKYAFVSDYVRLVALKQYGGVYFDTDVEVIKSFDTLLNDTAFVGFEESKAKLPATCVLGCEKDCDWVNEMLSIYDGLRFILPNGSYDMTPNVQRMGERMMENGLVANGNPQYIEKWGLRVYPFDYFSPITSTRIMRKTVNTYSIHHFASSWQDLSWTGKIKMFFIDKVLGRELTDKLIQIKRKIKI